MNRKKLKLSIPNEVNRTCILFLFLVVLEVKKRGRNQLRKEISFIHAADLHIDSPFKGLTHLPETIKQDVLSSTFTALDQLVRTAIAKQVDFVLLVGDIFDHNLHSLKAQVHVRTACEKLGEHHIDVFMSFGNHDYLKGSPFQLTFPPNVHIFQSEEVTYFPYIKNKETIAHIYGFSYENQAVTANKAVEFNKQGDNVPYHIAMLHGSVDQQTDHEPYAPFKTAELLQKPFDYWALGHVHSRTVIHENPPIVYPGNTQGRHRGESGEKGCYYVKMNKSEANLEFIPLHSIEFKDIEIDITDVETIDELEHAIQHAINPYDTIQTPILFHITCKNARYALIELEKKGYIEELVDVCNSSYEHAHIWKYIYKIRMEHEHGQDQRFQVEDHFLTELEHMWEHTQVESLIEPLFNHVQARTFLQQLSNAEKEAIKQAAREELLYALVHKRGI